MRNFKLKPNQSFVLNGHKITNVNLTDAIAKKAINRNPSLTSIFIFESTTNENPNGKKTTANSAKKEVQKRTNNILKPKTPRGKKRDSEND